jgi:type I site-specific restriction endonuclease
MQLLNLPQGSFRIRNNGTRDEIFDPVRKRFVALTPEEWVRQNFMHYLINSRKIPSSLMGIEIPLTYNNLKKRGDIVIWSSSGIPRMIVECKAPEVKISQDTFHQVAMYNMAMNVEFIVVTNGLEHFACRIDHENKSYSFLQEIPSWDDLKEITKV